MISHAAVAFGAPFIGFFFMAALGYGIVRYNRSAPKHNDRHLIMKATSVSWHIR